VCHTLTRCASSLPGDPPGAWCPPARTLGRGRRSRRFLLLRVDPLADDAEGVVTPQFECAHEIGDRAIHVGAPFGAEPAEKGVKAGPRPGGLGTHGLSRASNGR